MNGIVEEDYLAITCPTIEKIMKMNKVLIYGAGVMGRALKLCIESKPYFKNIYTFIVSDMNNNSVAIGNTPVIGISDADEYKDETIIVALNESNMPGAVENLYEHGFNNLILLNAASDDWSYIKACFFMNNQDRCFIPFKMLPERI